MLDGFLSFLIPAAPVIAVLTIVGAIVVVVWLGRARLKRKSPGVTAKRIALVTGLLGVANGLVDLSLKLSGVRLVHSDPGAEVLRNFYRYTLDDCPRAWSLIHPARKEEIFKAGIRNAQEFCRTYATTRQYRDLNVVPSMSGNDNETRRYWVSFDVQDQYPTSTLYSYRTRSLQEGIDGGVISRERVLGILFADLRLSFAAGETPQMRDSLEHFVTGHSLDFLLSPEAVTEAGRYLGLSPNPSGPAQYVWTHTVQHVTMEAEGGWKVRAGLYPPAQKAPYPPGAEIPNP